MELEKSNYQESKFRKFVPRKQINEGWHYYKIHNSNIIVGVRTNLKEIYFVTEKGGEPIINQNTKLPIMEWNQETETRILTDDQYRSIQESGYEEE